MATELTPTVVMTKDSRIDGSYGTPVALREVYIDVTTTATDDYVDLDDYVDGGVNGIKGVLVNSVDGATSATSVTWSSTTVTFANHAGSGGVVMLLLVY